MYIKIPSKVRANPAMYDSLTASTHVCRTGGCRPRTSGPSPSHSSEFPHQARKRARKREEKEEKKERFLGTFIDNKVLVGCMSCMM